MGTTRRGSSMCSNLEKGWIMHGQCKSSNATKYMYIVRTDLEGSPDDALLNDWKQISCIVDF